VLARGGVRDAVDDRAWLQAMLDFEAALARALARAGLASADDAEAIAAACRADAFDAGKLGREAAESGNPVVPLVAALVERVGGGAAAQVHRGATSQDVMDTAAMLVARRALAPLLEDLRGTADAAAALAEEHRRTVMPGRTLLQQAVPITFGLKAAGWLVALDAAADRLREVGDRRLAVQLGGAAGTLASLGADGPAVLRELAAELALAEPVVPWHTDRTRIAELAGALGAASGVAAKVARDLTLLAQTEVGEAHAGSGGSSTMPHKRNPVPAVLAVAAAAQAPALVATLLAAMVHEHERAAGAWQAEWPALTGLLRATGSAVASLREALEALAVDPERMSADVHPASLAERVAAAVAPQLGRQAAAERVRAAALAAEGSFAEALAADPGLPLDSEEAERLLDPAGYLGAAERFVDRALEAHRS